jgi:hypothetical protein
LAFSPCRPRSSKTPSRIARGSITRSLSLNRYTYLSHTANVNPDVRNRHSRLLRSPDSARYSRSSSKSMGRCLGTNSSSKSFARILLAEHNIFECSRCDFKSLVYPIVQLQVHGRASPADENDNIEVSCFFEAPRAPARSLSLDHQTVYLHEDCS